MSSVRFRDIHCRAKHEETGEWEVGYLVIREQDFHGTPKYFLQQFGGRWLPVKAATIGQVTNRYDIDNREVYEGDIVNYPHANDDLLSVVVWSEDGGFQLDMYGKDYGHNWARIGMVGMMKVVGNIHDGDTT